MVISALVGSALAVAMAAGPSVSGVYVGAAGETVQLVQLIKLPDGRLAGRLEEVTLDTDGAVKDDTIPLEGAADGEQITLSPKSLLLSGNAASLTGFVQGDTLDLSWQGSGHITLTRSDAYAFEAAVTGLKARSLIIRNEKDARQRSADHQSMVATLIQSAQEVSNKASSLQREAMNTEQQMQTSRYQFQNMQIAASHDRHRERVMQMVEGSTLAASDNGVKAAGIDVEIESLHTSVEATQSDFTGKVTAVRQIVAKAQILCRTLAGSAEYNVQSACESVETKSHEVDALGSQMDEAFAETEDTYQHPMGYTPIGRRLVGKLLSGKGA